jgi:glycosyltransferase involved in cell wall biosynthesis
VIKHQQTGLLVPERDEGALARGILEVLADPSRAAGLAMAGLEYARQYFDWGDITDRLEEVYTQAIVDYRARRPVLTPVPVGARLP